MTISSVGVTIFSHGNTNSCGVMSGYLGRKKIKINTIKNDNQGRILIVDADIEETFVLINLYKPNDETEQIKTIYELDELLGDFGLDYTKNNNTCRQSQFIFDPSLEASRGKPALKKKNQFQNLCKYLNKTMLLIFGEFATQF